MSDLYYFEYPQTYEGLGTIIASVRPTPVRNIWLVEYFPEYDLGPTFDISIPVIDQLGTAPIVHRSSSIPTLRTSTWIRAGIKLSPKGVKPILDPNLLSMVDHEVELHVRSIAGRLRMGHQQIH